MHTLVSRLLLLAVTLWLAFPANPAAQKPITLEDIWSAGTFDARRVPGFRFQNDGVHYTALRAGAIEQYDLRTGEKSGTLLDPNATTQALPAFSGYAFSPDEDKILLVANEEKIYRWSTRADYFVYDRKTQALTQLHDGPKQRCATFSPDGKKVAYSVDNDLYVKDLSSGKTTRLSTDGQPNAIINGTSDWVYEEEFELVRAFEWSPDGSKIAYLRFDERQVPEFTMDMYRGGDYPEPVTFKYPKVGARNSVVTAHIFDLASAKTLAAQLPERGDFDDYLPRIGWTPGGQLCVTHLNRHQNHLRLFAVSPATGACTVLLDEISRYYLDLHEPEFLADGSFVWQSEKSGYNHLYLHDKTGKQVASLTKGDWDVTGFYGVDEKNGLVFFQAAAENPMQREIYTVKLNGKGQRQLSKSAGTHSAQFSRTFDYFVDTWSGINTPPQYTVCDRAGKPVRSIEQNEGLRTRQTEYGALPVEFFQVPVKDASSPSGKPWNGTLNGWMIRPTAPEFQGKKLPVLMYVYGGPGSQQVTDAWKGANYWWFQMLAQQGYVVACVDNRGTGARGEEFKKMTYLNLGKYETEDQIAAAKYLGSLPYVDAKRVGIFGWSYGGYMSSLCMLKGGEVFSAGIAVAPVTHWKWYDSAYTERYMRTEEENPDGYAENAPVNFADKLGGKYLLVHGLADDNVHFQHSAEMTNRLIAAGKPFDSMFYPNLDHGISGGNAKLHLYGLMTNFLNKNLKNAKTDVERP